MRAIAAAAVCVGILCAPRPARADSFAVPVTLSTSGVFLCLTFAPCFTGSGTNQIAITNATGTATVTFNGVYQTFSVSNSVSQVTLGQFAITATPGFIFPVNFANPDLPIVEFRFTATGLYDSGGLWWTFGPGGSSTLQQFGSWDFSVRPDVDPAPFTGLVFKALQPTLATNATVDLTADASLVPEPGTLLLIGTGLFGTGFARRRMSRTRS
jgi:hypothetical protein